MCEGRWVRDGIHESSQIICRSRGFFICSFLNRSLVDFAIGNGNSIADGAHFQLYPIVKSIIGRFSDRMWKSLAIWNAIWNSAYSSVLEPRLFQRVSSSILDIQSMLGRWGTMFFELSRRMKSALFLYAFEFSQSYLIFCTYDAYVCSRMFTYVHVCSRMFTYVRVFENSSTIEIAFLSLFLELLQFSSHSVAWCV